ncbi:hypothetical protein EON63_10625 [archaeon]|nr:MAG: hypothetical protein EON63_10625 [archaeon]
MDDFGLPLVPDIHVKTEKRNFTLIPLQVIPTMDHDPETDSHFIPQHRTSSPKTYSVPQKLLRTRSRSPTDFDVRESPTEILKNRYRSSSLKSIEEDAN